MAWFDTMTFAEIEAAIRSGAAPGAIGGMVHVPPGFIKWGSGLMCRTVTENKEQVESPLPESEQKQPLQGPDGEAPAADPGIGAPGPLPDAGPQEGQVVEGVGGDAEEHLGEREVVFFEAIRDAIDDLHFAYSAARAAGCEDGNLTRSTDALQACLVWGDGFSLRLSISASLPPPEDEPDRPS